jgi:hypothetical protein
LPTIIKKGGEKLGDKKVMRVEVGMNDRAQSIVASILAIGAGAWMLLTPVFTSVTGAALTNMLIVGAVVAFFGLVQTFWVNVLPSWLTALAAIWAFIAAFATSMSTVAAWNMAMAAVVAFLLAIWDGMEVAHFENRTHPQI